MKKNLVVLACVILALCFIATSVSYAEEKQASGKTTTGKKASNFGKKVIEYPAKVTEESAKVVADTGVKGVGVVTNEVKRTGEVITGDVSKTKEMVTEPITGTAETAVKAVEGTVNVPVEAAKEKPASTEKK